VSLLSPLTNSENVSEIHLGGTFNKAPANDLFFHIGENSVAVGATYSSASHEISLQLKPNAPSFLAATTNYPLNFSHDLDYLASPRLIFCIYGQKRTSPDLVVQSTNLIGPAVIVYNLVTRQFSLRWSFYCPNSQWQQTKRMLSLPDLADSRICHSIFDRVPKTLQGMEPVREVVRFDQTTLELTNFVKQFQPQSRPAPPTGLKLVVIPAEPPPQVFGEVQIVTDIDFHPTSERYWLSSTLPSEDEILNKN